MSWSGRRKFDLKCFRRKSTVSSHTVCSSKELICTPDSTTDMCSNQCYRHKCCATDTSAEVQTQVLYHRHVYNATDTSDVLRHYSGCSSRSKGLICTCDGGAVSVCLGLSQPLPKDHLALSMLNICVQLALSFISSPIISPQPALSQSVDHIRMFYRFPPQTCA